MISSIVSALCNSAILSRSIGSERSYGYPPKDEADEGVQISVVRRGRGEGSLVSVRSRFGDWTVWHLEVRLSALVPHSQLRLSALVPHSQLRLSALVPHLQLRLSALVPHSQLQLRLRERWEVQRIYWLLAVYSLLRKCVLVIARP